MDEAPKRDSQYLSRNAEFLAKDMRRDDPDYAEVMGQVATRLNQSYPDGDVSKKEVVDILKDSRIKREMRKINMSAQQIVDELWNI